MLRKKKSGVSLVTVILSITILLVAAGLVIDTGIVLNAQQELQKQVETTALFGATVLEPKKTSSGLMIDTTNVNNYIQQVFNVAKSQIIQSTLTSVTINPKSKAVAVQATGTVQTYFLNLAGINTVSITAQAAVISSPFYLSADFPKSPTTGSLLTSSKSETDVRQPLGSNKNLSLDSSGNVKTAYLYGFPDNKAVSLGPGGYIMIRLPVPLIDGDGADLYIREQGNMEGYFVFAGSDVDPNNPYINEANPGSGIKWTNISCTGTPEGSNISTSPLGAYYVDVSLLGGTVTNESKFYGSGYFDIGTTCTKNGLTTYDGDIKTARYLKIIDDNEEDGFISDNPLVPVTIYGEHASVTPGADIDAVAILHHARLIKYSDFSIDTDGDGLIDVLEKILGTSINNTDTDGDGISDDLEYVGWYYSGSTPTSIIDSTSAQVYLTSPLVNDSNLSKKPLYY